MRLKKTERKERPSLAGLAMMPDGSCSTQIEEMTSCAKESAEPVRSWCEHSGLPGRNDELKRFDLQDSLHRWHSPILASGDS